MTDAGLKRKFTPDQETNIKTPPKMNRAPLTKFCKEIAQRLGELKDLGTYKTERIICSRQSTRITLSDKSEVLNFCANNYLGLASHPAVTKKSVEMTTSRGAGLSSVRFICGTQDIHKELEKTIAKFHGREDAITYISCFDANGGVFDALLTKDDVILSDELNHASIIDGIRLCKATKSVYKHRDMKDLEDKLTQYKDENKNILIATDGVFSMDGNVAPLKEICDLADKYGALTFVDDCHATGFFGKTGRGTEEYCGVEGRIDIINSTLGKAIGGSAGGYTVSSKEIIDWLRQKSRPYLFSNSIPPTMVGSAFAAFELIEKDPSILKNLQNNTTLFRTKMKAAGFVILGDNHPICPVMMPDERTAVSFADELLKKGIYVIGFTFPVVPKGKARIRVQMSAVHTTDDVQKLIQSFIEVGRQNKMIQ